MYYAFATQNFAAPSQTLNIQVSTSLDGINWTPWTANAVLPQVGPWAKAGNIWAPSVADNADNDFVMYYTATETGSGDQCIGVATSVLPLGPTPTTGRNRWSARTASATATRRSTARRPRRQHRPRHLHRPGHGRLVSDVEERRQPSRAAGQHHLVVDPARPGFPPDGQRLPTALLSNDQAWQSGIVEGPDMVATPTTTGGSNPTTTTPFALLLGQRRGGVHLRHRLGQLPRPLRSLHGPITARRCSPRRRACRVPAAPTSSPSPAAAAAAARRRR